MSWPMPVSCADTAVAPLGFLPDLEPDLVAALLDLPPWATSAAPAAQLQGQGRRPPPAMAAGAAQAGVGAPHPAMRPVAAAAQSGSPAAPPQQARQGAAMPELQRLATFSSLPGSTSSAYTHSAYNGAAAAAGPHAGYAYTGACHSAPAATPAFGLGGCGYTSGYCGPSSALPHPNQLQPQTAFPGPGSLKPLARAYSSVDGPGGHGGLRHSEDQQLAPADTYAHALPPGTSEWHPRQFCPSLPGDVHHALAPRPVPLVPRCAPTSLLLHRRRVQLQRAYAQCQVRLERLAAEAALLQAQVGALTMGTEQHQGLGAAAAGPLAGPWAAPWGCAPTAGL